MDKEPIAKKILKGIRPGDIVALARCHDRLSNQFDLAYWLKEMDLIVSGLKEKGTRGFAVGRNYRQARYDNEDRPR